MTICKENRFIVVHLAPQFYRTKAPQRTIAYLKSKKTDF